METASFTHEQLEKFNKKDLIEIILKTTPLFTKLAELSNNLVNTTLKLKQLEASISISQTTSSLLEKRVKKLETELYTTQQYSRRECIEIVGIPDTIPNDQLTNTTLKIFESLGVKLTKENDVQACHRIGSKGTTIIKLSNRQNIEKIMQRKFSLKGMKFEALGFRENTKVFLNDSLCFYYRKLWGKCKDLFKAKKIFKFATSLGAIRVKISENDSYKTIRHEDELNELFPGFEYSF